MRIVWVAIALCSFLYTQHVMSEDLLEKDETGHYHLWSPFQNHNQWKIVEGSTVHHGADEYAKDWTENDGGDSDLGMPVYPVFDGTIVFVGNVKMKDGFSKEVFIRSNSNGELVARYAHLCATEELAKGNTVSADTLLGYVGKSGLKSSDFAHLHLALYEGVSDNNGFTWGGPGIDPLSGNKIKEVRDKFEKSQKETELVPAKERAKDIVDSIINAIDLIEEKADTKKLEPFKSSLTDNKDLLENYKKDIESATKVEEVLEIAKKAKKIAEIYKGDFECGTCVHNIARAVAFAAPYKVDIDLDANTKRNHTKGCGVEETPIEEGNDETPPNTGEQDECSFSDINDDDWYQKSIETLCKQGIVTGYDDNLFKPKDFISRVEFLKMVLSAKAAKDGNQKPYTNENTPDFSDFLDNKLAEYKWAYPYINYAKEHGIMTGYDDGTFKPTHTINRAEAAKVVVITKEGKNFTLKGNTKCTIKPFNDVEIDHWFCRPVAKASELSIFKGEGDEGKVFNPSRLMNRAEGAKVACRILEPEEGC